MSKRGSKNSRSGSTGCGSDSVVAAAACDEATQVWTPQAEREYYRKLGCHIATVARPVPLSPRKKDTRAGRSNDPSSMTCSQLDELHRAAERDYPWLIGVELFDPSDYYPEDIKKIPDVAMSDACDEEEDAGCLTIANTSNKTKICFVTVFDVDLCDVNGETLTSRTTATISADSTTTERKCTTFIVLCPRHTFVHMCSLRPKQYLKNVPIESWAQLDIQSDVQPLSHHLNIDDEHPYLLHFPFVSDEGSGVMSPEEDERTYFCSQSELGQLTHYFAGNFHAIDFACPIGTMLHSPVDGTVVQVNDMGGGEGDEVSGIAATNMFQWNSIMLKVDDDKSPLFVELVHIQTKSCVVKCGDEIKRGQFICRSGSVGFSPEPHVHMAAYRSAENAAATVRFRFKRRAGRASGETGESSTSFVAKAGCWYTASGLVPDETVANI